MRKVIAGMVVLGLCVMLASPAIAARSGEAKRNTGCGLGTMLFKNSADGSMLLQAFQATTNGTSGNQTFGVTTGTSECEQPSKFAQNDQVNEFVLANMDNLAKDIAMGQGETLETLAELLQVPEDQRAAFYGKLQASFAKIFTSKEVVLAGVVDNIADVTAN